MLFVDASVIVAIVQGEDDAEELMERLDAAGGPYYVSAVVRMEASLSLARRLAEARRREGPATADLVRQARALVDQFINDVEAREVSISGDIGVKALDAAQVYGKIVGHPAQLNMGDCFAYACARGYRVALAYKGNDFSHTDIGW
ncbi:MULTISPECIES: type II toxin-antitoxin system VapC family toxin [unclassified Xanthobacter]|uniref:type II toxin-antitoxin system VapC family toxin n=1 Tax=unclassified Xanthobacter TaxID=2623496 RepID=UPI001F43A6C9|nr:MULTISPECIES: type II toxin-antitoxin system VapC family toxin [unclassified Xanthobacter]